MGERLFGLSALVDRPELGDHSSRDHTFLVLQFFDRRERCWLAVPRRIGVEL